jgi:hypothetical protein
MQENITINRHSDEIHEIITKVPSWIVRWGIVLFGAILLMVLSISAVIRYPDTIKLTLKLQTTNNAANNFGLVEITQDIYTKVKVGQRVLVHLKVFSSDAYLPITGVIENISDSPNEKGLFTVKIKLNSPNNPSVKLKSWMTGTAEIITQDITILQRVTKNLTKGIDKADQLNN